MTFVTEVCILYTRRQPDQYIWYSSWSRSLMQVFLSSQFWTNRNLQTLFLESYVFCFVVWLSLTCFYFLMYNYCEKRRFSIQPCGLFTPWRILCIYEKRRFHFNHFLENIMIFPRVYHDIHQMNIQENPFCLFVFLKRGLP